MPNYAYVVNGEVQGLCHDGDLDSFIGWIRRLLCDPYPIDRIFTYPDNINLDNGDLYDPLVIREEI